MGAVSFVSPLILLALAALPAIWFILRATPPKPTEIRFPAFEILRRLARTEETPDRTPWPLLLLRLIIAGLVILALAGPLYRATPAGGSKAPILVVLDNSWAAAPGWRLRKDMIASIASEAERSHREAFLLPTINAGNDPLEPLTGAQLRERGAAVTPSAFLPSYENALGKLEHANINRGAEIFWLADGLAHDLDAQLKRKLSETGDVTVYHDAKAPLLALAPDAASNAGPAFDVQKIGGGAWRGDVVAAARDGRELARTGAELPPGPARVSVKLDLPLALQNDIAAVRIDGVSSAGAVHLADARSRRALVGVVTTGSSGADPLLSGAYYVRRALEPYAQFVSDSLDNLLLSDASVIVLDDVGTLRATEAAALKKWVEDGGVLIRFAGPKLAEAADEGPPALLPVALRGGGRAFGGALTWETPQKIGAFNPDGPFAGLSIPDDLLVRRQVLAEPGGETSEHSWASLKDGTPLVTGTTMGGGAVVLFHVTATPDWSDLPLSALFVEMLRKLTFLSTLGPKTAENEAATKLSAFRVLDGFGALKTPPRILEPQSLAELELGASTERPPGLYGAPEAPVAVNAVSSKQTLTAANYSGLTEKPYGGGGAVALAPPLFLVALLLLMLDGIVALFIAGKLRALLLAAITLVMIEAPDAKAQPLDRPLDPKAVAAALDTRLAFVKTGDPATDRISEEGLAALSRKLSERTSLEPSAPAGVDPESDDLSVYPLLYWPMTPGAATPSEKALSNIETYLKFGGLILFDTRDDERAVAGVDTPERLALKAILTNIDIPPLTPLPADHVLTRSFYLLSDLAGRMSGGAVWVQAGGGANDSVTPVIIGGRDWAGAWAADELGRPLFPMTAGGERAREIAYRAGVNIVMVALTGNYKSDQVHTPVLLERLGRQ